MPPANLPAVLSATPADAGISALPQRPVMPYSEIWVVDFEFSAAPGERPLPLCGVFKELISGREIRRWEDELRLPPPFSGGPEMLYVAFYASAEMGCHLALDWPLPVNVVDLYAEFRVETNGRVLANGNGLLGALAYYGIDGIAALEKTAMRDLVLRGGPYSDLEQEQVLAYCATDVVATEQLFGAMWVRLNTPLRIGQALLRGRYTKAVARMEWAGVPIDGQTLARLRRHWERLQGALIERVDADYGVYEGRTFKTARFADYLVKQKIDWPVTATGRLALDDATFVEQAKAFPALYPLRELRHALGQLRLSELAVGKDDRNRCLLSMFRSKTGRNQPSTTKFVYGLSAWLRGLIQPVPGTGLAYVDWSQQEFGIAAALSGDVKMQAAYASGDPYLAFAVQAGAVPATATAQSHPRERGLFKACVLAVQYGMGGESLARRIQQPPAYARELLRMHRQTYADFWRWSAGVCDFAVTQRKLWTVFGWELHVEGVVNPRSLCNFPMQANGAEMLRLACCLGTEAGIRVIAPVHDALLIEAPLAALEATSAQMQGLMAQASREVLGGFELRSDVKVIRAPERYADERGVQMWGLVQALLDEIDANEVAA